jgi:hypothetical protein
MMPERHTIRRLIFPCAIALAVLWGATADAREAYRSSVPANRGLVAPVHVVITFAAATSPPRSNGSDSVGAGGGGAAPWGLLLGVAAAVAAFIICGLVIVMRSRREYLAMTAREASRQPDEDKENP